MFKHNQAIRQYVLWRAARQQYNFEIVVDLTTTAVRMRRDTLYHQLEKAGYQYVPGAGWINQPLTETQHVVKSSAKGNTVA